MRPASGRAVRAEALDEPASNTRLAGLASTLTKPSGMPQGSYGGVEATRPAALHSIEGPEPGIFRVFVGRLAQEQHGLPDVTPALETRRAKTECVLTGESHGGVDETVTASHRLRQMRSPCQSLAARAAHPAARRPLRAEMFRI